MSPAEHDKAVSVMRDLYASLDARRRPEDVAKLLLASTADVLGVELRRNLTAMSATAGRSYMSDDFQRSTTSHDRQVKLLAKLFAADAPAEQSDIASVLAFLRVIEGRIGKAVGQNSFKHDRLNREAREQRGMDLSRRQYNKRFRITAKVERKLQRRDRAAIIRVLTLASKSRLASKLSWEDFSSDRLTACFIAYYVARCNLRSIFTVNSQTRAFDDVSEGLLRIMRTRAESNWFAVAHVLPDADVVGRLTDRQRGELLGRYYELLVATGGFLREVWDGSSINRATMIVQRGNDSST